MIVTLDFETFAIQDRPEYPPKPVGISIKLGDAPSKYYAFGHPTNNNCELHQAIAATCAAMDQATKLVFHNAPFDCSILIEGWGLNVPWEKVEDTMVLAFILHPHGELALKPLAEKHLHQPPEERDAVRDWIYANGLLPRNSKQWGAFIAYAPGDLVGTYAEGDTDRTYNLHLWQMSQASEAELSAYRLELQLMPHVCAMEKRGVRVDANALEHDIAVYTQHLTDLDATICRILGQTISVDSNEELADALEAAGKSKGFASTKKGKRSVSKDSLIDAINDPELLGHILVRNSVATCIRTFMQPWYSRALVGSGRIYIRWNQVRNYSDTGARTGRLSSSPNLQNIPTEWEGLKAQLDRLNYTPAFPLPQIRKYIIPDDGNILIGRDYAAQELRLLAHFAGGTLLAQLKENPLADVHMIAANIAGITRKVAKTLGFAILYGAGVGRIAESLYTSVSEATAVKQLYLQALPEIGELQRDVNHRGRTKDYISTLGGRRYFAEEPKVVDGRLRSFEYKLVNYLIQGSAADQTKRAMVDYASRTKHGWLLLSVHDQLVVECPVEHQEEESRLLEQCMNGAFQGTLDYQIISEECRGFNFAEV